MDEGEGESEGGEWQVAGERGVGGMLSKSLRLRAREETC